jgi:hypothetical protein
MGAHRWSFNACSLDGAANYLRDGAAGRQRTQRCIHTQEDMFVIDPRAKALKIMPNGVANLLRKW